MLQGSGRGASDVVEKVHANGEISGVEKSDSAVFDYLTDARQFVVPSGGTDHNVLAAAGTGLDVFQGGFWSGEVNDHIKRAERFGGEGRGMWVVVDVEGAHVMLAFVGNVGYQ